MPIDVHIGGNNHWDALITFVNEHINDQLYKNIERLKEETGTESRTSQGRGGGKIYDKYCTTCKLLLLLDSNSVLVWSFGPLAKEKGVNNDDDDFPKVGPRNAWHP